MRSWPAAAAAMRISRFLRERPRADALSRPRRIEARLQFGNDLLVLAARDDGAVDPGVAAATRSPTSNRVGSAPRCVRCQGASSASGGCWYRIRARMYLASARGMRERGQRRHAVL